MRKRIIEKGDLIKLAKVILNIVIFLAAIFTIRESLEGKIEMFQWLYTDRFWLIVVFFVLIFILVNINTISPLGRKSQKLLKLTKLPETFDRAITVERSPDWGMSDLIIITNRYGKYPHLRFDMRVINRTYYPYKAKEAKAKCCCGSEEVLDKEGKWDNNTKKSETFEWVTNLPVWGQGDGSIMYHVPIKKLYDDMKTWRLRGKVKYKSREPLIDDNQYANPEIDIELEYILSEKQILALKKEVEKALGEVIIC